MKTFYVDKTTSTPADTLLAFGLADFLQLLVPGSVGNNLTIIDAGDCYRLELDEAITQEAINNAKFQRLFSALYTGKSKLDLPDIPGLIIDYKEERRKNSEYFEAKKSGLEEDELTKRGYRKPPGEWPAWVLINVMSADYAFNSLAELWFAHRENFPTLARIVLNTFSSRPNAIEESIDQWKDFVDETGIAERRDYQSSQLQVVNPGMGKGGNNSKADGISIGGRNDFWILEYLKFAGFLKAALPRNTRSGDRKTYIVRPKALLWGTHKEVFREFQERLYTNTAIKLDILAILYYCTTFLEQWKAGQEDSDIFSFGDGNPGDHVAALETIFYKDLGSAYATMNQSTLALPNWIQKEIQTTEDADQLLALFTEHQRIFRNRNLDEKQSDHYNLLRAYRDFLSARDLRAFFRFIRGYSKFIMQQLITQKRTPPQFTTSNLEVLLMAHDKTLSPIIQNQGFRNFADAIRHSTVLLQYRKAKGQDPFYTIRYGLGEKLIRNAQYREDFIKELSQFAHTYNRENARKKETRGEKYRQDITTEDLKAITELIDEYDSATIANLLVAYGYAYDPDTGRKQKE